MGNIPGMTNKMLQGLGNVCCFDLVISGISVRQHLETVRKCSLAHNCVEAKLNRLSVFTAKCRVSGSYSE